MRSFRLAIRRRASGWCWSPIVTSRLRFWPNSRPRERPSSLRPGASSASMSCLRLVQARPTMWLSSSRPRPKPSPERSRTAAPPGGLMTAYATDMYRQVGVCIGRIIKGAKPGDLPVAQRPNSNLIRQGRGPQWALATLLVIAGEQGSARTLLSKMLRALVDANVAPLRTLLREEHDLFIAANNGHVTTCRPCRRRMHCWRAGRSCRLTFTHFWNFDLLSTY
jgi:hypothetical protein